MKTGIMAGTFNPIHNGHMDIARIAMDEIGLDECLFVPDSVPPHKIAADDLAPARSRFVMTALSLPDHGLYRASDIELRRPGETHTIDTLKALKEADESRELYLIAGSDVLGSIERWYEAPSFGRYCSLFIVPRSDTPRDGLNSRIGEVSRSLGLHIIMGAQNGPDISSTAIRNQYRIGEGSPNIPRWADTYIHQHGLYGATPDGVIQRLKDSISAHRLEHTYGVADEAVILAARYGEDTRKAYMAGLLHDCAKGMDAESMLGLIAGTPFDADAGERALPQLLHAPAGALLARRAYGIADPDILSAIRWHTTGRTNMTALEKIIYLADVIEPSRHFFDGLDQVRMLAETDLDAAVRAAGELSVSYVLSQNGVVHEKTREMLLQLNSTDII